MSHSQIFTTIPQRTTPAQTSAAAAATGRFFSRFAGTGRRRHGRGAAPVLDESFSGGAGAGEKATFSLTYGKARQEKWVYVHLRKVVSAPSGPSLDDGLFLSGEADPHTSLTAVRRRCSCVGFPSGSHPWILTVVRMRSRSINETTLSQVTGETQMSE